MAKPAPIILPPPTDRNPPESLHDIIEKRIVADRSAKKAVHRPNYRRAAVDGVLAGVLFVLLMGTVFLIRSIH